MVRVGSRPVWEPHRSPTPAWNADAQAHALLDSSCANLALASLATRRDFALPAAEELTVVREALKRNDKDMESATPKCAKMIAKNISKAAIEDIFASGDPTQKPPVAQFCRTCPSFAGRAFHTRLALGGLTTSNHGVDPQALDVHTRLTQH